MNRFSRVHTLTVIIFLAVFGAVLMNANKASAAIPGAPNSTYPDTSLPGDPETYMVNEICSGPTNCMRSKTTVAGVYVPQSLRGQTITIVISDGCDNTSIDLNKSGVWTDYHIQSNGTQIASTNSETSGGCIFGNGNVNISFTAQSTGHVYQDGATAYDIYYFVGDTRSLTGKDGVYYYNYYRLGAVNVPGFPDIKIGVSPAGVICPYFSSFDLPSNWQYSCPSGSPSYAYSSFGQVSQGSPSGGYYGQKIDIPSCQNANFYGRIDLYDLDSGQYSQTNIRVRMTDTDLSNGSVSYVPDVTGLNLSSGFVNQNGNDQHLWLPGAITGNNLDMYTFLPNHTYTLEVYNLTRANTLQILPVFSSQPNGAGDASCAQPPPGSCVITSISKLGGGPVYAGDPIQFNVVTNGVNSGRQLGVNGAGYGGTPASGGFSNYLVSGTQFARGSPVGVAAVTIAGKEGTLPSTGTTTIDDMMFGTSGDGSLMQIIAPNTPGSYPFSWGLVNPGIAWDGVTCSGTLDVAAKPIKISGHVYNAYNTATKYEGVLIYSCVPNVYATTDASGYFEFTIPQGSGFCVGTNDLPNNAVTYAPRPTDGWSYMSCAEFTADRTPNYCTTDSRYNFQIAGQTIANGYDRGVDKGYDLVFRYAPKQKCVVGASPTSEVGTAYVPDITVFNTGDSNRPPIETGNIDLTVNGTTSSGDYTPFGAKLTYGNSIKTPGGFTMTPASIVLPNPSTYPITANFSAISPGAGDGIPAINDNAGGGACEGSTNTIRAAEPYVRAYGSDIVAGGGFASSGGTCNTYSAGVYGFASGSGTSYKGSASQYGITTHSNILSFFSAGNRAVANTPPRGLTFSNTTSVDEFGTNFGGTPPCISDYFSDPNASPAPLNGGTRDSSVKELPWAGVIIPIPEKRRYVAAPGNVIFGPLNVKAGSQVAIYIDGNLAITGDITFDSAASIANLPNLAVIVRGNIYITSNVKRLDGLYVAQPKNLASPTDGRIYTCAKATFQLYNSTELTTQCGVPAAQQLAINGALIAQQVKFLRTMFSVKDSTASSTSPSDIPNFLDGSPSGNSANTKAAEVINYTPEIFLAPSALKDPNQACLIASCKYDSIYSLPPVF